tara:strand:- start:18790 stop:19323 length:534 start_codon:yes stop_codon:yes gene_type:complete
MKKGILITVLILVVIAAVYFFWGKEYLLEEERLEENESLADRLIYMTAAEASHQVWQRTIDQLQRDYPVLTGTMDNENIALKASLWPEEERNSIYYFMYNRQIPRSFLTAASRTKLASVEIATRGREEDMADILEGTNNREHASIEEGVYRKALYALANWPGYSEYEFELTVQRAQN